MSVSVSPGKEVPVEDQIHEVVLNVLLNCEETG